MNHHDVRNHRDRQGPNDEGDGSDMFHSRSKADETSPRHLALLQSPKRQLVNRNVPVTEPSTTSTDAQHALLARLTPHARIGIEEGFRQVCEMPAKGGSAFFSTQSGSTDPRTSASGSNNGNNSSGSNNGNNSSGDNSSSNPNEDLDIPDGDRDRACDSRERRGDDDDDDVDGPSQFPQRDGKEFKKRSPENERRGAVFSSGSDDGSDGSSRSV